MPFLQICRLSLEHELALADFFRAIEVSGDGRLFHPHPFNDAEVGKICRYTGKDHYYLARLDDIGVAYGILRGWDEGFAVPSLGIIVRREFRGKGLGALMMAHLHAAAYLAGAQQIRLKVYPDNTAAIRLYKRLGYRFAEEMENNQLVGYVTLTEDLHPTGP